MIDPVMRWQQRQPTFDVLVDTDRRPGRSGARRCERRRLDRGTPMLGEATRRCWMGLEAPARRSTGAAWPEGGADGRTFAVVSRAAVAMAESRHQGDAGNRSPATRSLRSIRHPDGHPGIYILTRMAAQTIWASPSAWPRGIASSECRDPGLDIRGQNDTAAQALRSSQAWRSGTADQAADEVYIEASPHSIDGHSRRDELGTGSSCWAWPENRGPASSKRVHPTIGLPRAPIDRAGRGRFTTQVTIEGRHPGRN